MDKAQTARSALNAKFANVHEYGSDPYLVPQDYNGFSPTTFPNLVTPVNGDNLSDIESRNIGKTILKKMLELAPERFTNFPNNLNSWSALPLEHDDTLSFVLTVNNDNSAVPAREYVIKLRISSSNSVSNQGYNTLAAQTWT